MIKDKFFFNEITLLKVIGVCLITWFHFKWTVPQQYANFFIGGAFGNSLFFYSSGYLLKVKRDMFCGEWFIRKYIRIMPAVWITCFASMMLGKSYNITEFIYPTSFWFINSILCYFFVIYIILNRQFRTIIHINENKYILSRLRILFVFVLIVYLLYIHLFVKPNSVVLDSGGWQCMYFFLYLIWGMYDRYKGVRAYTNKISFLLTPFSIGLFFAYKMLAPHYELLITLQSVFIPVILGFVIYSFRMLVAEIIIWKYSDNTKFLLNKISALTLEIYVVQMFIIDSLMPLILFPLNIFACLLCIFFVSYIVHIFAKLVGDLFNNKLNLYVKK